MTLLLRHASAGSGMLSFVISWCLKVQISEQTNLSPVSNFWQWYLFVRNHTQRYIATAHDADLSTKWGAAGANSVTSIKASRLFLSLCLQPCTSPRFFFFFKSTQSTNITKMPPRSRTNNGFHCWSLNKILFFFFQWLKVQIRHASLNYSITLSTKDYII